MTTQITNPKSSTTSWLRKTKIAVPLLVGLGLFFLVLNLNGFQLTNWWSIFILLPALALFAMLPWVSRWENGRYPILSRSLVGSGLIILCVSAMFFLNLNWSSWWPLMLILPGSAILLLGAGQHHPASAPGKYAFARLMRWNGASIMALGLGFLLYEFRLLRLPPLFLEMGWWGVFILVPGAAALTVGLKLLRQNNTRATTVGTGVLLIAIVQIGSALLELTGTTWQEVNGILGIFMILSGAVFLLSNLRQAAG